MRLFGFEITRTKAPVPPTTVPTGWDSTLVPSWGQWAGAPLVQEPFTGAWQRNLSIYANTLLAYHAIYRCVTLISQDISKCRICLVEQNPDTDIWSEVSRNSPFWPVLSKPNRYQNRIQFFDEWIGSKLIFGNTYVLLQRDQRGVVTEMYILNPVRTRVTVAPDGSIYYRLATDDLAQVTEEQISVPASEIIHDRYKPLYHPLVGISPIMACAMSGMLGLEIQANSSQFFKNASRPGGILSAPEHIEDDTARRLKEHWESNYSGMNAGKVAVLGDGLKYEAMRESAVNSQLVEQLKISAGNVCTAFGVPAWMIGVGEIPAHQTLEALYQAYYSQCLQNLIETVEILLDEGLGLPQVKGVVYGTEFDLEDLLRMDTSTKSKTWGDLVKQGIAAPNEAREAFDMEPVKGGDNPYLQQQNYSLEALAKRDSAADPFASAGGGTSGGASGDGADSQGAPAGDGGGTAGQGDGNAARAAFADKIIQFSRYHARRSASL